VRKYTHLRLSWYLPLPELITHRTWLKKEALWLSQIEGNLQQLKKKHFIIPNLGKVTVETDFNYPLIKKYQQLNLLVDFDFSPIFYATTKQIRTKYNITQKAGDTSLTKTLRSLSFSIRCFPAGFIVFNAYLNFINQLSQPINHKLLNKLLCGKKLTTINKYVNYLKSKFLTTIFESEKIPEIKWVLMGPKIRIQFIENGSKEDFLQITKLLFSLNEIEANQVVKNKTNDYFLFSKKGVAILPSIQMNPQRRQYFRHNIDLIIDIVYGIETLLPILPKFITQIDQKDNLDIGRLIFTYAYTLNPEVLNAITELDSLLPTAGTRKWFSQLAKEVKLYNKYSHYRDLINERIDKLRVDSWYKIVATFLLENIPGFTSYYMEQIKKHQQAIKDIIAPKVKLDEEGDKIINWFIKKFSKDLKERYTPPVNDMINEEEIGYSTLFQVEKNFGIQGRAHSSFKLKIDVLNALGLLESKPYKGPGAKEGSKKYRANPNHQYVLRKLKMNLKNSIIAEIKLRSV